MILKNINDTEKFAKELIDKLLPGDIICLVGDLSAGKTTLSKYIIKALGINDEVISPTFNYVKEYNIKNNDKIHKIYHFDVYRIKSTEELLEIGFYDYINDKNSIKIIEWADIIEDEIPKNAKWIYINIINENTREIIIK